MLRETLLALLQPVVTGLGYELWELEYQPGRGNALLRIYLDTEAAGGITVEDSNSWKWRTKPRNPRLTIESGAVVNGTLRFEREVDLYLGHGVVTGPVEGVEPRRYAIGAADAAGQGGDDPMAGVGLAAPPMTLKRYRPRASSSSLMTWRNQAE